MQGNEMVDFQFLAENSVDVICRGGLDRVLHYVSPSSLLILGWEPREMIGRKIDDFVLAEDFPLVTSAIARSLSSGIHNDSVTLRMKKKDGSTVWMEVNSRIIRDLETEEVREFIVAMRDVSDRKLREEKLSALALTDGLTGFPIAGPLTKH
jgi:PAS domain S-box-containing protein